MSRTRYQEHNPCWRNGSSTTFCLDCGKKLITRKFIKKRCRLCADHIKIGIGNPNWKDGSSFNPYPKRFNQQLKEKIRVRDNFICQLCGVPELELNRNLHNHHIDYNKENCKESNLISLCHKCNSIVNGKRDYYKQYFQNKLKDRIYA
jgi:hypothetical protein